jgi:hypothetical protein
VIFIKQNCTIRGGGKSYLEVSELGELLPTLLQLAGVWFRSIMDDFVGTNVALLSKAFPADIALIWSFAGVTALVCLKLC